MGNYTRTVFIEIEVEVNFDYSPGCEMRMYMPNGDPGYPAEPEEWDICEVNIVANADEARSKTKEPKQVDIGDYLTSKEFDEIEQQLNDMGMEPDYDE